MENWDFALLKAFNSLGGEASLPQVYEALQQSYWQPDFGRRATNNREGSAFQGQARRHILKLSQTGYLEKLRNGSYLLTPKGRERFFIELRTKEPNSPLLKRKLVVVDVQVEPLQEGGYLASCDAIQGCHAEGETVAESLANLEDVARILLELQQEEGRGPSAELRRFDPNIVVKAQVVVPLPG